jgi:hypothetical protein
MNHVVDLINFINYSVSNINLYNFKLKPNASQDMNVQHSNNTVITSLLFPTNVFPINNTYITGNYGCLLFPYLHLPSYYNR